MVLKIELFCPKQLKIGQTDILEIPDFKSKLLIPSLIISPMLIKPFTLKKYKGTVTYKGLDFNDFLKKD